MSTPHQHDASEATSNPEQPGATEKPADPATQTQQTTSHTDDAAERPQPADTAAATQDQSHSDTGLFADNHLSDLRARWNDVQAGFVDDPRECVQKADHLVSSAVEQLTKNFAQTRSRLEEQWQRGQEASTEDLRVALKRYRDFFDRLLSV